MQISNCSFNHKNTHTTSWISIINHFEWWVQSLRKNINTDCILWRCILGLWQILQSLFVLFEPKESLTLSEFGFSVIRVNLENCLRVDDHSVEIILFCFQSAVVVPAACLQLVQFLFLCSWEIPHASLFNVDDSLVFKTVIITSKQGIKSTNCSPDKERSNNQVYSYYWMSNSMPVISSLQFWSNVINHYFILPLNKVMLPYPCHLL